MTELKPGDDVFAWNGSPDCGEEGLFVGHSSGAAAWAALELARSLKQAAVVVVIFPDGGEKYLDAPLN